MQANLTFQVSEKKPRLNTPSHLTDGSPLCVDIMIEEALASLLHAISNGVQWGESILVLQLQLFITVA